MASGRSNKLTGQIGEFLVCAELGRQGIVATPFAGNVPAFDILAADEQGRAVPIQVKTSRSEQWPSSADLWLRLKVTKGQQQNLGWQEVSHPHLIYVFVALKTSDDGRDRFFLITKAELQQVLGTAYIGYMDARNWQRPRNPRSFDCRLSASQLTGRENFWSLVTQQLAAQSTPTA